MKAAPTHFWHTTPLHYLPHLLREGCLYSQDELRVRQLPIRPRRTAAQRDRKLRLSRFVHLSFAPQTPLLADKFAKGYPHALLAFDATLAAAPEAALIPFNTKSWRHREDFAPIYESEAKALLTDAWRQGRYPSAELLIEKALPLNPSEVSLFLASDEEAVWLTGLLGALHLPVTLPLTVSPELFPPGQARDLSPHHAYAEACRAAGRLLPPPDLPFD